MEGDASGNKEGEKQFIYAPYTLGFLGYTPPNKVEVSEFKKNEYEEKANRYWDEFYKVNKRNFFKDRHWITREFPLLKEGQKMVAMELGCGVGNTIFPLIKENPSLFFYGLDFAKTAITLMKAHPEYDETRCKGFVCDITKEESWPSSEIPAESVDVVTMIFVLSAVSPERMKDAITNLSKFLKKGGVVLFRDYAEGDMAQERFESEGVSKIADNFHVRGDGTRAYYFSKAFAEELWKSAGFIVEKNDVVEREVKNRKLDLSMDRLFLQGLYRKP